MPPAQDAITSPDTAVQDTPARRDGAQVRVAATVRLGAGAPAVLALRMAAVTDAGQSVTEEAWTIDGAPLTPADDHDRVAQADTTGAPALLIYTAAVDLADPTISEALVFLDRVRWTEPSRYCPSDMTVGLATGEFGTPDPGAAIDAVTAWVQERTSYQPGSSTTATTALETLGTGAGVCRDFAHLSICLLRSLGVPARYVAAYAPGLEPPDFHALVEAHDGERWRLVDPTGLTDPTWAVRIATGRDGAATAFMTVLTGTAPVEAVDVAAAVSS